jgi:hypothetical protein
VLDCVLQCSASVFFEMLWFLLVRGCRRCVGRLVRETQLLLRVKATMSALTTT